MIDLIFNNTKKIVAQNLHNWVDLCYRLWYNARQLAGWPVLEFDKKYPQKGEEKNGTINSLAR